MWKRSLSCHSFYKTEPFIRSTASFDQPEVYGVYSNTNPLRDLNIQEWNQKPIRRKTLLNSIEIKIKDKNFLKNEIDPSHYSN